MQLDEECRGCLFRSQWKKVERDQNDREKLELFRDRVRRLCESAPEDSCAPLLMREIDRIHRDLFGCGIDYSREKSLFNRLLLSMEDRLYARVADAPDPLGEGLKYAMAANYIDFARLADLDENAVDFVMQAAEKTVIDPQTLACLHARLSSAKTMCFLHDNCGEVVLDKILIRIVTRLFPQISVISVVRGSAVINDVTEEDARSVGLDAVARVIGNGTDVPGTPLGEINAEVRDWIGRSDVILSKGLGNLETLYGEVPAFYCFCCKCEHIVRRFSAPLWSSVLIRAE